MGYYSSAVEKNKYTDHYMKWIVDVIVVIMAALFFISTITSRETVDGNSMMPVFKNGDKVLMNRLAYGILSPDRYDIIVFEIEGQTFIKKLSGYREIRC
jgi:signal peptidase I